MFRYRLHLEDGSDAGEATYAQMIHLGDEIHLGAGQRFRVVDVVPFDEEDESPFVGLLQVEAVARHLSARAVVRGELTVPRRGYGRTELRSVVPAASRTTAAIGSGTSLGRKKT
jgi:hypothetical protein